MAYPKIRQFRVCAVRVPMAQPHLNANTISIREQVKESVEFVRLVWGRETERPLREEES